ncbi:hypothetical protein PF005_g31346 [Phytophthora fragariae]|uniref:Secreted protein n=1 Tax=Phytophthora fragariae TaxID=53985 RepID=A0A6A3VHT4_9STRA|nr:hypothetical protein PF003_g34871 [Phytophthora fragariae]KAE8881086.1 hypothetical protein PF003_g34869 [Phytophthora fragariae]KAE8918231.1 hypothetical protein PF009_g31453 [Phytophthora fragariae]KAE8958954.1 hypothetical protein PF011_g30583 [Phytophthora fragariae]KAE9058108.1 hypothetical protein PF010_g31125 [Phytophthora fragariae]
MVGFSGPTRTKARLILCLFETVGILCSSVEVSTGTKSFGAGCRSREFKRETDETIQNMRLTLPSPHDFPIRAIFTPGGAASILKIRQKTKVA